MAVDNIILDDSIIASQEINIEETAENEKEIKYCLNCGTEVSDKFCPHCGQSTGTPSKLKMKNFGKGLLMSFGRLTPGFFNTAKGLIWHPWDVIRDHIHGKHIRYSPPITMVIQVLLYATVLYTFIDAVFGTDLTNEFNLNESIGYTGSNALLKLIDQSVVVQTLVAGIPLCFGIYIGFYRHGSRKYNFAEYLAAFTYMYATITIYDALLGFLYLIPGFDFDVTNITLIVVSVFSVIILLKAFPQIKPWKTILLLIWSGIICILLVAASYMLIIFAMNPDKLSRFLSLFRL